MKHLRLCAVALVVLGCSRGGLPITSYGERGAFGIYFLKDSSLTGYQASQVDVNQLELRDTPWLTDDGIDFYDFSSHCIYLKEDKSKYFEGYDLSSGIRPLFKSNAFVVVANAERCYVGSLHSAVLSTVPWGPSMDELSVWYYPPDVLHIARSWIYSSDVRNDVRIRDVLNSLGLYHGGISVQLQAVHIVENADTSTVDYVCSVTNNDRDNLFVLDPDKMGAESFHHFTNGIVFRGNNGYVQSQHKRTSSPSVDWDPALYVKVSPNASIERTVRLQGYPKIPPGSYNCSFDFANPVQIGKENRTLSDGRIWLGDVESNRIEVVVQ
jgi:hypothetical protein